MTLAHRPEKPLSAGLAELESMIGRDVAITVKPMLTAPGLAVGGKVFAFEHDGALVLKLPKDTVSALIVSGEGCPFGMAGRIMKEWVAIPTARPADQLALAQAAVLFVGKSAGLAGPSR